MVNHRVLLPPVKGGASVVVTDTARSARQLANTSKSRKHRLFSANLDPLVEDGVANPTGRNLWAGSSRARA